MVHLYHISVFLFLISFRYGMSIKVPKVFPDVLEPKIYGGVGYTVRDMQTCKSGGGTTASLELVNPVFPDYGQDEAELSFIARQETATRLHVRISTPTERWEVPQNILPRPPLNLQTVCDPPIISPDPNPPVSFASSIPSSSSEDSSESDLQLRVTEYPFGFSVSRRRDGTVLFDSTPNFNGGSTNQPLIFKDQFLQLSTSLPPDASLFGLGESTTPGGFKLVPGTIFTLYNTDMPSVVTDVGLYGSHPFYLDIREDGRAHGVLLLNSNGMDVLYDGTQLTYRVIGGILDFYFFEGPTALSVVQQYTELVGRPAAQPYWAFGWHQCRYGYKSVQVLEDVVANYSAANLPLEVLWSDIDYMDDKKDFTVDHINYPLNRMRALIDKLHGNGQKYVVIIDPGIAIEKGYPAYDRGIHYDIFLRDNTNVPFVGQSWAGPVHFPDFSHPSAEKYWEEQLADFHTLIAYDGLWIDMNEVSNFCSGITCRVPYPLPARTTDPDLLTICMLDCDFFTGTHLDFPPYAINYRGNYSVLSTKSIPASALHHGNVSSYNVHNLYSFSEAIATRRALQNIKGLRPFILTRSTFSGAGSQAAHWTGDNNSTWADLGYSITQMLNFGIFGIPMVGADICGFDGNTNEELCRRWIQTGAFYPFARDHSAINTKNQEPYRWRTVAASTRKVLATRYRLLPYLYTLAYESHIIGSPIVRPLNFLLPFDPNTLSISRQFTVGPSVLISPVITKGALSVRAYIPAGYWYSLPEYDLLDASKGGQWMNLSTPGDAVNVHLREGTILPLQDPALTTTVARNSPFTLVVAFGPGSSNQSAEGRLFLDAGDDTDMVVAEGKGSFVKYSAALCDTGKTGWLRSEVIEPAYAINRGWVLNRVVLLGVKARVTSVVKNKVEVADTVVVQAFSSGTQIEGLQHSMGDPLTLSWGA